MMHGQKNIKLRPTLF